MSVTKTCNITCNNFRAPNVNKSIEKSNAWKAVHIQKETRTHQASYPPSYDLGFSFLDLRSLFGSFPSKDRKLEFSETTQNKNIFTNGNVTTERTNPFSNRKEKKQKFIDRKASLSVA